MATYEEICSRLGMRPEIQFVIWKHGYVDFTLGKPDEIRLLLRRCRAAGLRPSRHLQDVVARYC